MPTNPIVPQSGQPQPNVNVLGGGGPIQNIDATPFAKDIAKQAGEAFIPNLKQVTGFPTVLDANSLGIIVAGAGVGQIKRFVAEAAIKKNKEFWDRASSISVIPDVNQNLDEQVNLTFQEPTSKLQTFPNPNAYLGGYLFDTLIIKGFEWTQYDVDKASGKINQLAPIKIPDIRFTDAIISVSITKNIVETIPVTAPVGSVKEIMALGEYRISVQGHIINPNNPQNYYDDMIKYVNILTNVAQPLDVTSVFLNIFGINTVIIQDLNIQQVEGFRGILTYNMTLISETVVETFGPAAKTAQQLQNKNTTSNRTTI